METATCKHREKTELVGRYKIGTCTRCGQQTRYPSKIGDPPTVIKLGHIDSLIVMPDPNCKVQLSPQDMTELHTTSPALSTGPKHPPEPAAGIPPRPSKDDPVGRVKWFRKYKPRLIDDLLRLGKRAFIEKYEVTPHLVGRLKADKRYKQLSGKVPKIAGLPSLPSWSNDWPPNVQAAWLNACAAYAANRKK